MEKEFINYVLSFSRATGLKPQSVIKKAVSASWREWDGWVNGTSSLSLVRADKIITYIDNQCVALGIDLCHSPEAADEA